MRRGFPRLPLVLSQNNPLNYNHMMHRRFISFFCNTQNLQAKASANAGTNGSSTSQVLGNSSLAAATCLQCVSSGISFQFRGSVQAFGPVCKSVYESFLLEALKKAQGPLITTHIVCPVDGTVLRFGELKEAGAMIEQVKGFPFCVSALLGASSFFSTAAAVEDLQEESRGQEQNLVDTSMNFW